MRYPEKSPESLPVIILGGGVGCLTLLDALSSGSKLFKIVAVADRDPMAPGIVRASLMGIINYHNIREAIEKHRDCTAINMTGSHRVSVIASEYLGPDNIIGGREVELLRNMFFTVANSRMDMIESNALNRAIIDSVTEGIILIDYEFRVVEMNPAAQSIFEYDLRDVVGKDVKTFIPKSIDEGAEIHIDIPEDKVFLGLKREMDAIRSNGDKFIVSVSVSRMTSESHPFYVCVVSDISQSKENEMRITKMAYLDALTGIPNRALFFDRLEQGVSVARRSKGKLAVLFLDLDGFKQVNDSLGHEAGDFVLCETAERLKNCIRDCDTAARLGGDEFSVILSDVNDHQSASKVAEKILSSLARPISINGKECNVGCSIGISIYPEDAVEPDDLLRRADEAMYRVKGKGKNDYSFYNKLL